MKPDILQTQSWRCKTIVVMKRQQENHHTKNKTDSTAQHQAIHVQHEDGKLKVLFFRSSEWSNPVLITPFSYAFSWKTMSLNKQE